VRMTEDEYMAYLERTGRQTARQKPNRQKYNNKRTWVDGICFHSKKEADYYQELKLLMQAGEISGFCLQPEFVIA
jgi:allantoicase